MTGDRLRYLKVIIIVLSGAMFVYHMAATQKIILTTLQHLNLHLGLALLLVFLSSLGEKKRFRPLTLVFILASLAATAYVHVLDEELVERLGLLKTADIIIGIILIILVIESTRRSFGLILPIFAVIFTVYPLVGRYLPGVFHTAAFPLDSLLSRLVIGLEGIYGMLLSISANYIFLFVVFGALMQISGATRFFEAVGRLIGRQLRSGAAMTCIISSALVGMVTGSVAANIATCGSFSIPMMKSAGYKPEVAGAIETSASTGGQIMPPVMGAAAFIMSGITGIPYVRIMFAAFLPALLYFANVGIYAHLQASKLSILPSHQEVNVKEMLVSAPAFFIPLGVIVALLIAGYTPMYAIFWALVALIILSLFRKPRPSLNEWADYMVKGATTGARIAVSCALLGLVVTSMTMTGLGIKFPAAVEAWSGGSLFIMLILVMVISIVLGMGVPTSAAYILVALVCAPILVKAGVGLFEAHFFIFFYAVFSFIVPPIAEGAIIAAQLAGAKYMPTAIEATKASLIAFILPFLILATPILLLQPQSLPSAVGALTAILLGLVALQIGVVGYYQAPLRALERSAFLLIGAVFVTHVLTGSYLILAAGLVGFALMLTFKQLVRRRKHLK